MAGVSLYAIQKILGHSSPATTQRYAKLSPEYLGNEIDRLDFEVPQPPGVTRLDTERQKRAADQGLDTKVDTDATASR
jgi:hypothetical protein